MQSTYIISSTYRSVDGDFSSAFKSNLKLNKKIFTARKVQNYPAAIELDTGRIELPTSRTYR